MRKWAILSIDTETESGEFVVREEAEGGEARQQSTIIRSHSRRESDVAECSSFLSLEFLPEEVESAAVNAKFFGVSFRVFLALWCDKLR